MTTFDIRQALRNLDIEIKPFGFDNPHADECRGYSGDLNGKRYICISPRERWPVFVTMHEMAHHLRGDCVLHRKFNVDPRRAWEQSKKGIVPTDEEMERFEAWVEYKEKNHDIIEAECHATAIIACQLTDTPFDLRDEVAHLEMCYTHGRQIPKHVMESAYKTAKKIWAAGKLDERSMQGRVVAA